MRWPRPRILDEMAIFHQRFSLEFHARQQVPLVLPPAGFGTDGTVYTLAVEATSGSGMRRSFNANFVSDRTPPSAGQTALKRQIVHTPRAPSCPLRPVPIAPLLQRLTCC